MMKVMIVDDELLVQVGLRMIINWEEYGLTVVGEAKNGQEALEIFSRLDPDIIFVDIAMPIMNGFELIKALKAKKPTVKTCILTSHTDFNYVKEAAKLNVGEYLLKSELTRDNLAKCINKMLDQQDAENPSQSREGAPADYNPNNSANLSEDDLFTIITGFFKSEEEMQRIVEKYKFSFQNSIWFISMALIVVGHTNQERYQKDPNHFRKVVLGLSKQVFSEKDFTIYTTIIDDKIVFLYNINRNEDVSAIKDKIINLLCLWKNNIKQFLNIDLYIGMSASAKSFEELSELYKQAYKAKENCFFAADCIEVYDKNRAEEKGFAPKVNFKELEKQILKGDQDELEMYLNEIFDKLFVLKNKEYVKNVFIDLLREAKVFMDPLFDKQVGLSLTEASFDYSTFNQLNTFESVKDYIVNIYREVAKIKKHQGQMQYSYTIQKSIDYIKRNYRKNITLSDVAECAEVSKNYLSFLFKQEIKTNFSLFLLNFRIDKAKELLVKENAKIYEIANMVGFENPYYFSKVFREIVGVSCKDYQKLYYKNETGTDE